MYVNGIGSSLPLPWVGWAVKRIDSWIVRLCVYVECVLPSNQFSFVPNSLVHSRRVGALMVRCLFSCHLFPHLSHICHPSSQTWRVTATTPTSSAWPQKPSSPREELSGPGRLPANSEWTCSSPAGWKSLGAGPSIPARWEGPRRAERPAQLPLKTVSHFLLLTPWKINVIFFFHCRKWSDHLFVLLTQKCTAAFDYILVGLCDGKSMEAGLC